MPPTPRRIRRRPARPGSSVPPEHRDRRRLVGEPGGVAAKVGGGEIDPLGLGSERVAERLDQRPAARFVGAVEQEEAGFAGHFQRPVELGAIGLHWPVCRAGRCRRARRRGRAARRSGRRFRSKDARARSPRRRAWHIRTRRRRRRRRSPRSRRAARRRCARRPAGNGRARSAARESPHRRGGCRSR